tara:strand:- start:827 stop:1048 length:222 start_codon:yes stop_codon:yes gene_type:complete
VLKQESGPNVSLESSLKSKNTANWSNLNASNPYADTPQSASHRNELYGIAEGKKSDDSLKEALESSVEILHGR